MTRAEDLSRAEGSQPYMPGWHRSQRCSLRARLTGALADDIQQSDVMGG